MISIKRMLARRKKVVSKLNCKKTESTKGDEIFQYFFFKFQLQNFLFQHTGNLLVPVHSCLAFGLALVILFLFHKKRRICD